MDLRCSYKKHGELVEPGLIEIKCNSRHCGAGNGQIVLHLFDAMTGQLLETKRFKQPGLKGVNSGTRGHSATVWSA